MNMDLPASNLDYREQSYWDERYTSEDSYDWFSGYTSFKHLLKADIQAHHRILTLGCGNSPMSAEMYRDGFHHIVNTDFSSIVIDKMSKKHSDMIEMSWQVMDMCNIEFPEASFDIVLEKGTIDALMVQERDPWNVSEETCQKIDSILNQVMFIVSHILKPGGKFISITFSQTHFRKPLYARSRYNWDVQVSTVGDAFHFFYMVMEKGRELSEKDRLKEVELERRKLCQVSCENIPTVFIVEDTEDFALGIEL
ncbi:EEF1A lysine methyltransferase 4-like isoform X1 [Dreissena polymorpha]|uniref:EEF1A lysine methyltransferase 4 n=1 Tax=Dreissena polymorpha TaxID=45954 RepID=A0A9D4RCV0_DREPO|nr:EEF1A lysine methyltransferase 4-like isoform X1 [Dreissena polymorpha]XP_052263209.1 EEF1A lysine methyltransferase 4-like isoform X1 [Dreissena polymorpha]XP_052263210.1 EEF1A lysine methyltransferase 4-like isoform X1 [Dreissena polymorpha]KAH3863579.1 hypothetical protein DPMN_026568 [Dreissena polymorpha]